MTDIVVEVKKGMVVGLYCDIDDARFVVVDWDLLENEDSNQHAVLEDHARLIELPPTTRMEYRRALST